MRRTIRSNVWPSGVSMIVWIAGTVSAGPVLSAQPAVQPPAAAAGAKSATAPIAKAATTATGAKAAGPFRRLAPGVVEKVESQPATDETFARHDLVEVLAVNPAVDWAKDLTFRRDVWCLQFGFKPMRYIEIDLPQPNGRLERRRIRYLVYCVTNPGHIAHPIDTEEGPAKVEYIDRPVRFVPMFYLTSREDPNLNYPDRLIPAAQGPIRRREDPNQTFYNSAQMCREIGINETVWGYLTWVEGDTSRGPIPRDEVDPRIDYFSIYVTGLTNAYLWEDNKEMVKAGSPIGTGRILKRKVLKLNFWRPGDEHHVHEEEFRFGIPGEVDYEWIYR